MNNEYLQNRTPEQRKKLGYITKMRITQHKKYAFIKEYRLDEQNGDKIYYYILVDGITRKDFKPCRYYNSLNNIEKENMRKLMKDFDFLNINISDKEYKTFKDFKNGCNLVSAFRIKENSFSDCCFINGYKIAKARENRIVLMNKDREMIAMDIFDIFELSGIPVSRLLIENKVKIKEFENVETSIINCDRAIKNIKNNVFKTSRFADKYPDLYEILGKHRFKTIMEILELAKQSIMKRFAVEKQMVVFYMSLDYILKNLTTKIDRMELNRILRVMNIFGLMERHFRKYERLGIRFKATVKEEKYYDISYYSLNDINWEYANNQAKKILESKINISKITKTDVIDLFGQRFANGIFEDIKVKNEVPHNIEENTENFVISDYEDKFSFEYVFNHM